MQHDQRICNLGKPSDEEEPLQLRKLFIGGISRDTTEETLKNFYSRWGTVVDCFVVRDPITKCSRHFGFVIYAKSFMVDAAVAVRPHIIAGKMVDAKRAIPRDRISRLLPSQRAPSLDSDSDIDCKLLISGIHQDYHTVDDLRHYFGLFGVVEQIEIFSNPQGCGFVLFEELVQARNCLNHGTKHFINGRECVVTLIRDIITMDLRLTPKTSSNSRDAQISRVKESRKKPYPTSHIQSSFESEEK